MAILGIRVPHEVARALGSVDVPGDKVSVGESHITLVYFGSEVPIDVLSKAIIVAYEVASKTMPMSMSVSEVSCFDKGDDGVPVITQVECPELHVLQSALCAGLDAAKIDYSKKWPEFKPHVTLSYAKNDVESFPVGPLEWTTYEMVLWGGESGDDRISVTLPFAMPGGKEALYQKLIQARVRFPQFSNSR